MKIQYSISLNQTDLRGYHHHTALSRPTLILPKQLKHFFATDPGAAYRTCDFRGRTETVTSTSGSVRLKGRYDCTTASVGYVMACQRCHKLYVGETGRRLADRFGEHLRSVEGYNQNPRYQGGGFPVAEHFNLLDHNKIQDTRVFVVRRVQG